MDDAPGSRWDALLPTAGRLTGRSLAEALPCQGPLSVLAWPADRSGGLPLPTFREVLAAGRRGYPVVVLDLPRTGGERWRETVSRCDRVLVVVRPTVAGLASTARLLGCLPDRSRARLVLRGPGLPSADVASALGVPVVADAGDHRRVAELVELGLGPVSGRRSTLARAARDCLSDLGGEKRAAA